MIAIVNDQITLFASKPGLQNGKSAAAECEREAAGRALDELFRLARHYQTSKAYADLLEFVVKFRFYSPFNAMLIHIQMSGATYAAPPHRWLRDYRRRIRDGARPLVILQPKGPVMFVFDVSDTEAEEGAPPLPNLVERPFEILGGAVRREYELTIENAKRDGILVLEQKAGSQGAGAIRATSPGRYVDFTTKLRPEKEYIRVPLRYVVLLNASHSTEEKYATLVHELAHLYCGHLGTPDKDWWSDRTGLGNVLCEFEAESICYLVCCRLKIDTPSHEYLAGYMNRNGNGVIPAISLDCVMRVAGLIEQMGRERLKLRKLKEQRAENR
jgi:hypothetical protein